MDALATPAVELLGSRYPIVQSAMGWVSTSELVIATSRAGAFGFLACAVLSPAQAEREVRRVLDGVDAPFGVNFHGFQPGADRIVDLVMDHGVRAVSYGRAPAPNLIDKLKAAGVLCVPTVGAARHVAKAVELGADLIVCQGSEGGGHTGVTPTFLLLAQALEAVSVPVIAAGGFRDGRGLAAALAFGAAGIAMGTRFMMTSDSPTPSATKARYLAAGTDDTVVSRKLDGLPQRMVINETIKRLERTGPLGMTARALVNAWNFRAETGASFADYLRSGWSAARHGDLGLAQTLMAANAPMIIKRSMVDGRPGEGVLPSGQVAGLIDDLPTCEELVARVVGEARTSIAALR